MLWIGDLQYWMDENYLNTCFYQTGELLSAKVIRNKQTGQSEGYGFLEFRNRAIAENILQTYNGTFMPNAEQTYRLKWATLGAGECGGDAGHRYAGSSLDHGEKKGNFGVENGYNQEDSLDVKCKYGGEVQFAFHCGEHNSNVMRNHGYANGVRGADGYGSSGQTPTSYDSRGYEYGGFNNQFVAGINSLQFASNADPLQIPAQENGIGGTSNGGFEFSLNRSKIPFMPLDHNTASTGAMNPGRYDLHQEWESNSVFEGYGSTSDSKFRNGGFYDDREFVDERFTINNAAEMQIDALGHGWNDAHLSVLMLPSDQKRIDTLEMSEAGNIDASLMADEKLNEFDDQENPPAMEIDEEVEEACSYQLNGIGGKSATGEWFATERELHGSAASVDVSTHRSNAKKEWTSLKSVVIHKFPISKTGYVDSVSTKAGIRKMGQGTQLKEILNVAFKLSKRKADENLQLLHTILFGKKAKVQMLKRNIGNFSGFVWVENEETYRAKIKEKLDKCVKEKLLGFCDVLNIPVNKATMKKKFLRRYWNFWNFLMLQQIPCLLTRKGVKSERVTPVQAKALVLLVWLSGNLQRNKKSILNLGRRGNTQLRKKMMIGEPFDPGGKFTDRRPSIS